MGDDYLIKGWKLGATHGGKFVFQPKCCANPSVPKCQDIGHIKYCSENCNDVWTCPGLQMDRLNNNYYCHCGGCNGCPSKEGALVKVKSSTFCMEVTNMVPSPLVKSSNCK